MGNTIILGKFQMGLKVQRCNRANITHSLIYTVQGNYNLIKDVSLSEYHMTWFSAKTSCYVDFGKKFSRHSQ